MNAETAIVLRVSGQSASELITQTIPRGQLLRIGRAPQNGLAIPWGKQISREHADVRWDGELLHVTCVEKARNPLLSGTRTVRELVLRIGQEFRIGTTLFVVQRSAGDDRSDTVDVNFAPDTPTQVNEKAFTPEELTHVAFGNTDQQMEILANLPGMISASQTDEELAGLLVGLLLAAIPKADCVAVACFDEQQWESEAAEAGQLQASMLRVETRDDFRGRFRPSRRLILRTLQRQQSVIHSWSGAESGTEFTISEGLGWAFCAPIRGESCRGWVLYVSGQHTGFGEADEALQGDLRFTELVAQFIGSVRQVRMLQEQRTQLSTFFSPKVIENLTGRDSVLALTPAERDVTVLFCDVRGFSRIAELMSLDLQRLLQSVRAALGVMSNGILDHDGTIADFQGDAALGFWGWPYELEEGPLPACRAALDIHSGFYEGGRDDRSLLHGFSVGIGVVHGRAIAGQIGTAKQAKVGVFGPVVNQGARLESLTKQLNVPICIDEATATWIERMPDRGDIRTRRLTVIRPQGMNSAVSVYELLAPVDENQVSDEQIAVYEAALDDVIEGRWAKAIEQLRRMPAEDGPSQFLLRQMASTGNTPPPDWEGVFSLTRK